MHLKKTVFIFGFLNCTVFGFAQQDKVHKLSLSDSNTLSITLPLSYDTLLTWDGFDAVTWCDQKVYRFQSKEYDTKWSDLFPEPFKIICLTINYTDRLSCEKKITSVHEYLYRQTDIIKRFAPDVKFEIDSVQVINGRQYGIMAWDNVYLIGPVYKRILAYTLVNGTVITFNFANSTNLHRDTFFKESIKQLESVIID